ncbi:MAG: 3-isopropylmalate dehydratase small subunit [Rhodospirillales bacterium]|nr:3-isopropylmalate dehydratase small subunit [Rhodospirillales bacterium]
MDKFRKLDGIAAPLPMINVDTDMIIPKQFLKTIKRTGLGKSLFFDMRFEDSGKEKADFVLNREPYRQAKILVANENFGCGSSREHAPWALLDFGIRSVIAPSFADIFHNNCFKNGILPVKLPQAQVDQLMAKAEAKVNIVVDLETQTITAAGLAPIKFDVDPFLRSCLLEGLDDIGLTLQKGPRITTFEAKHRTTHPWLFA